MKPRVAIACQGGGSQTAFTAGVLKALAEGHVLDSFNIVSISGTSGGAICGFLIWYAWKRGERPAWKPLLDFWYDNTPKNACERMLNDAATNAIRLAGSGYVPQYNLSPSSPLVTMSSQATIAALGIRPEFMDLKLLLENHVNFQEVGSWGAQTQPPVLVVGACNVLTGRLHKFSSYLEPIRVEHLLASACVPTLFPAVRIDDMAYWDGLFSDNPPISSLLRPDIVGLPEIPNEIWVIKVNPTCIDEEPVLPKEIIDRRNELAGNVSLFHGLREVERINGMLLAGAFTGEFLTKADVKEPIRIPKSFRDDPDQPYHIPMIEMSPELAKSLTYESKLNRSPEYIDLLIRHGEEQGRKFLEARLTTSPKAPAPAGAA